VLRWPAQVNPSALLVAGIACLIQLAYLADSRGDPTFEVPIVDAGVYHESACRFAGGGSLADGAFWQPPLFPALLGVLYWVTGPNVLAARLVLAVLAVVSCLLLYRIGCRLFGRAVGLLAGLMLAAYGPFVFFSNQLLPTGIGVFLCLLALLALLRALERPARKGRWLAVGLCSGLAVVNVPNAGAVVIAALIVPAIEATRRHRWKRFAAPGLLAVVGAALVLSPITIRNYLACGEFVLLSTNGGINFYVGNNPEADATVAIRPGEYWRRLIRSGTSETVQTPAQQSAHFYRQAWSFARAEPFAFLTGLGRKAVRVVNAREIPRNVDLYVHSGFSPVLGVLCWRWGSFAFPFGFVAPFAVVGMIVSSRWGLRPSRTRPGRAALLAFALIYSVSVVLFFVTARYRLPVVTVMVLFAAVGFVWFGRQFTKKHRATSPRRRWIAGVAFVLSALLVNLPISAATDAVDFRAELYMGVGQAYLKAGLLDDAQIHLNSALELDPNYALAHLFLGDLHGRLDHRPAARRYYLRAAALDPDSSYARQRMGGLLCGQGQYTEAVAWLLEALALDPHSPEARAGLNGAYVMGTGVQEKGAGLVRFADALLEREQYAEAIECYRKAHAEIDLDPDTLLKLATLLATCPRVELRNCTVAIEAAEHLCRLTQDDDARALDTLATAYAACGRLNDAVRAQERAVDVAQENDPQTMKVYREKLRGYHDRLDAATGKRAPDDADRTGPG
jgi:tetratricopeptide (TPR) repeat protein